MFYIKGLGIWSNCTNIKVEENEELSKKIKQLEEKQIDQMKQIEELNQQKEEIEKKYQIETDQLKEKYNTLQNDINQKLLGYIKKTCPDNGKETIHDWLKKNNNNKDETIENILFHRN